MYNREVYQKDPAARKLVNEGVASVNDEKMAVLRYELETFVCDGQYEKGLAHILETYLKNIDQAQQPAVWVSGFYGSGKTHLVKMLRALWVDSSFEDGATARGIANLPKNIRDLLIELSTQGKRQGGLHAVSGTLGSKASGSVRLALLGIIFKSAGLPEQYPVARFVMWLKSEAIYEKVREIVEQKGHNWQEELDNFHVGEGLYGALCQVKPNIFSPSLRAVEILPQLYPNVADVSSDDMIKTIRQVLSRNGTLPLTLIVLDEVQAFIGENSQRSEDVREAVEACCKNIGGKLIFIGTGQTAVTGTSNLKKLEGRFTIRVELSDADVDAVIRQVLLAKKADAFSPIELMMQTNLGEISRHLSGTTIGHRQDDIPYFVPDYPILPVRRRFWENTLRVLDQTGTDSQLRNQLSMVHKVIQTNLDYELGHVVPADFLYFDSADKLLQSRILPRNVHEKTMSWIKGSEDERLMARSSGLVFLINKLAGSNNEIGIKATIDTLADLMVEDLSRGSSTLRSRLPGLLNKCELLMRVGDEYRIESDISREWRDEFKGQQHQLNSQAHRIEAERDDRIRRKFGELVGKLSLTQGRSKVQRDIFPLFNAQLPLDHNKKICVWVRDGWNVEEESVRADAMQAGNQSPTIFVLIPKRSADDLRHFLIDYKAAKVTLDNRGVQNTPEGSEARSAMETTQQNAEGKIKEFLEESFSGARVFQSGGNEITGNDLLENVLLAAENALQRLYPQFHLADHVGWEKVYARAKQGSPDALQAVGAGDECEPARNPVCRAILEFIGAGSRGADIRSHFEASPFGWPRDAVDGALQVLLVAGIIRAHDERGKVVEAKELERKAVGKALFKVETPRPTTAQCIQVRKLFLKVGCLARPNEELMMVPQFLQKMGELAIRAGGEAPRPAEPDTSKLDEIRRTGGNEQLLGLFNCRDELDQAIDQWANQADRIEANWANWTALQELLKHMGSLKAAEETRGQAEVIKRQRMLLAEPNLVKPLLKSLEDALRSDFYLQQKRYSDELQERMHDLWADLYWQQLKEEQQAGILRDCDITEAPRPALGTYEELIAALKRYPLAGWGDRIDALSGRFARAREMAARALEPQMQTVHIPRRTLKTEQDINAWVQEVTDQLKSALNKGPVVIR
ncbi:MAG: BREX system P-loop protein BrxC [Methanothrix sp.]